ncbi:alkaline phosphatase [Microbacterium sp. Au-Mic1]|uniref:alkaline phosphatase n=1 Tax=Microbacterium sp. Au-Mic1 TaxID=2906457 RepID=UPI001E3365D1|nr:alkaline phosphatase [Microbacterium sp. Au-Mic1]MCE4025492.1 alkaline phosphatase [Microbacterium sp. Au-Mic1]
MTARTMIARSALALALVAGAALAAPAAYAAAPVDPSAPGGATRNDGDQTAALRDAIVDGPAKNVILLIGDGMGDSEITVARDYQYGAGGRLPGIDALPLTGSYTTYSLDRKTGATDYVPDSAATGTAWATGAKSYDGAISVDIHGAAHDTLLELAKANGLKTGNVSTAELQDATPAVQAAHVDGRKCYGPDSVKECGRDLLENGGRGSISEQFLDTRADLTLGGGSASFGQTAKAGAWTGATLFNQATTRGYQLAGTADELAAITAADQAHPVLGTFTKGNFPTRFAPTIATVGGASAAPVTCTENPNRLPSSLSLGALTKKSIDLLKGDKGFFLQVEGASIDKQDHAADACGQIGETIDLDEAVQAALEFAKADGNTLVIVAADHAHSSQLVDSTPPTSLSIALKTTEGSTMKVSYGTSGAGESQQHTGSQVRIAGYGPGAANVVGLTDQTDNFFTIASALQLNRDLVALSAGATLSAPEKVAPGGTLTVTAAGLGGDRQVNGSLSASASSARSAVVAGDAIGRTDVIDGAVTLRLTAPTEPGEYTVALTGEQTGKALTVAVTVAEGAPTTPTSSPSPTAPAVALPPSSGNDGSLALTGGTIGAAALVALALIAAGLLLARARARRA